LRPIVLVGFLATCVAGCTATGQQPPALQAPLLSIAEAKAIIFAGRTAHWKDPDSIRDARIGEPYACMGALLEEPPTACVCVEANAKNSFGGYTGLKQNIAFLKGRTVMDFRSPRRLVPFPELNGKKS
jgi:hypothetical protein